MSHSMAKLPSTAPCAAAGIFSRTPRAASCRPRWATGRAVNHSGARMGDFLFEHDLRANAFRVCREGKPVPTFPDHALRNVDLLEDALGADFLGVGGHHGIGELLHGV